jgi:56kDa selenium binding protein (SBP56)
MRRVLLALSLVFCVFVLPAQSQEQMKASGHYMFAWTGDIAKKGNDFLAVIDADPASETYGRLITTLVTDQQTVRVHHTEYVMPASGMLFANDHDAGRTFIFDVRDPLHPQIVTSFTDMDGYMHPHSYLRLPNGHVLVSFQHAHANMDKEQIGGSGGLVEIDDQGKVIRSASSADPAFPNALLEPYSLVVLPGIDRVVVTNSSMHEENVFSGVTYQVFRLSDLKLMKTAYLDMGENHYGHVSPEEPRLGPDGAVYVQTLGCGIERISNIDKGEPSAKLVYTFPGSFCGVPTIVGHYLIQSVPLVHGVIALDIANGMKPVEASRLTIDNTFFSHWTGWDEKTQRLVVTGVESRIYLLKLDQATGALSLDQAFHDANGKPGFDMADRDWPHGWKGSGLPHGVVFSR